jgi:hypothetical protein
MGHRRNWSAQWPFISTAMPRLGLALLLPLLVDAQQSALVHSETFRLDREPLAPSPRTRLSGVETEAISLE